MDKIFGHLCSLVISEAATSTNKGNMFLLILIIIEFSTSLWTRSGIHINISLNLHIQYNIDPILAFYLFEYI